MNIKNLSLITIMTVGFFSCASDPKPTLNEWVSEFLGASDQKTGKKKKPKEAFVTVTAPALTPVSIESKEEVRARLHLAMYIGKEARTGGHRNATSKHMRPLAHAVVHVAPGEEGVLAEVKKRTAGSFLEESCNGDEGTCSSIAKTVCKTCSMFYCKSHLNSLFHSCLPLRK